MSRLLGLLLATLAHAATAAGSPRLLPQPPVAPLGAMVRDAATIHVLRVEAVVFGCVVFETDEALKGTVAAAPFRFLNLLSHGGCDDLFRPGARVLCFRAGEEDEAVATLYAGGRWLTAASPIAWRGEKNWFCYAAYGHEVTYDGPPGELRGHVAAVLGGREVTVAARAPEGWRDRGRPRLWRIKAGPGVTDFVLSDESPPFVGWGTGDPDEVAQLTRALGAGASS